MARWLISIQVRIALALLLLAAGQTFAGTPSPVADAVEHRATDLLPSLIAAGANVNAPQVDGMTALHWAAFHDDTAVVNELLERGADAKAGNRYGVTPLSLACTNGNAAIVTALLDAGADANAALPGGETPLMTAARTGRIGAVQALLAHGAGVDARERKGQTALMWAAAEGHAEVVQLLIDAGADIHARLASGFTAWFFAVRQGHTAVVDTLLAAGVDINGPLSRERRDGGSGRQRGTTALHLAVANAHFELAAHLLAAGADPNTDLPGYTALHLMPSVRNPGMGDNNPPPEGSGTMKSLEFVDVLVARGADVNARMPRKVNLGNTIANTAGATPFFLAAMSADAELLRKLVALGANPNITNNENSTPLMVAAGLGTRSPGEDAGTETEVMETIDLLLQWGADINATDDHGETAMHGAAYKNLPRVIALLATRGADPAVWNRKNDHGWSPLFIAEGYRFGNFKPSDVTIDAIHHVLAAADLEPSTEPRPVPTNYED